LRKGERKFEHPALPKQRGKDAAFFEGKASKPEHLGKNALLRGGEGLGNRSKKVVEQRRGSGPRFEALGKMGKKLSRKKR